MIDQQTMRDRTEFLRNEIAQLRTTAKYLNDLANRHQKELSLLACRPGDEVLMLAVAEEACAACRVDFLDMFSKNREEHVATARGIVMYIIREQYVWSFPRIGKAMRRHHSSVINLHQVITKRVTENPAFDATVQGIRQRADVRIKKLEEEFYAESNHEGKGSSGVSEGGPVNHLPKAQKEGIAGVQDWQRLAFQPGPDRPMVPQE